MKRLDSLARRLGTLEWRVLQNAFSVELVLDLPGRLHQSKHPADSGRNGKWTGSILILLITAMLSSILQYDRRL